VEGQGSNVRVTSVSGTVMTSLEGPLTKGGAARGVTAVTVHAGRADITPPRRDESAALTRGAGWLMSIKGPVLQRVMRTTSHDNGRGDTGVDGVEAGAAWRKTSIIFLKSLFKASSVPHLTAHFDLINFKWDSPRYTTHTVPVQQYYGALVSTRPYIYIYIYIYIYMVLLYYIYIYINIYIYVCILYIIYIYIWHYCIIYI